MSNDRYRMILMLGVTVALAIPQPLLRADDCNENGIDDAIEIAESLCLFPDELSENSAGITESVVLGAPDDVYVGLGADSVTYKLCCDGASDLPGPDITVYEVDFGALEFGIMDILISENGLDFFSVKASETTAVAIPGDGVHSNPAFARSYDIAATGLQQAKFVRIQGTGSGAAGASNGFDLDAIGIVNGSGLAQDCNTNTILDDCEVDCNDNGIPDIDEIDCDGNGQPDDCDIALGLLGDCNTNQVPDICELVGGTASDCNNNEIPDNCEPVEDCNGNSITDICDIGALASQDCNGNQIPDECEIDVNSLAPGGPFFCNSGCADDCDVDGVPDSCGTGPFAMSQPVDVDAETWVGNSDTINNNRLADDFVLPMPTQIGAIEIHGYMIGIGESSFGQPNRPIFRITIYADNPGPAADPLHGGLRVYDIPGEVVATIVSPPYSITPTGNVIDGGGPVIPEYKTVFNLPQVLELTAGAHWLSVVEISEDPGDVIFLWSQGEIDALRSRPGHVQSHSQLGWARFTNQEKDLAFALHLVGDCDESSVLDACEIGADPDLDCPGAMGNGVLDSCEDDCDSNGVADSCDIEFGDADDCNHNGSPDACDLSNGVAFDVNANTIPDSCETDCDFDSVPDEWQIETGSALDANTNGKPDHCEVPASANAECVNATPVCPGTAYHGTTVGDDDGWVWFSWTPTSSVPVEYLRVDVCGSQIPVAVQSGCTDSVNISGCSTCETMSFNTIYTTNYASPKSCVLLNFEGIDADPGTTHLFAIRSDGPEEGAFNFTLIVETIESASNCENVPEFNQPINDCDGNGIPDDAQPDDDCNTNGVRDICEANLGISTDCDGDGVPDECMMVDCNNNGIHDACDADCNRNGSPDDCDIAAGTSMDCNGDGGPDECDPFGRYGARLSINGTPYPDHWFVGPPDELGEGIGGQIVEYDFGDSRIIDGPGRDFNVYEDLQWGHSAPEFEKMDVLVSDDGINFVSVKATESTPVAIPGDESHYGGILAKSYNLTGSGLSEARFVRIEGIGDNPGGSLYGFELDAIGAINFAAPDLCAIPGDCDTDGDVDMDDYADMNSCMQGPNGGVASGCECFDLDNNGDIDMLDFAKLQVHFTHSQ